MESKLIKEKVYDTDLSVKRVSTYERTCYCCEGRATCYCREKMNRDKCQECGGTNRKRYTKTESRRKYLHVGGPEAGKRLVLQQGYDDYNQAGRGGEAVIAVWRELLT